MEHMTPWGVFWVAFFGALPATLPIMLGQILTYRRQMAELRLNTRVTVQGQANTEKVVVEAAGELKAAAKEMDSATKNQAQVASASATIAKTAAKDSKNNAMDAKLSNATTTTAVENLSAELKEFMDGYLTQRLQEASRSGYAMGVSDQIGKTVEEHGKRLGNVETQLGDVRSDVKTVLELVKGANGDRATVRGESIK